MTSLTTFQQALLRAVQEPLALCERPFAAMAEPLGCGEEVLLAEIRRLKDNGLIRRYRPQLRYRALGRAAVLAAAAVPEERLEQTAAVVSALAGVSHNYQRDGRLNLWFTLQGAAMGEIDAMLERLRQTTGLTFYSFAAERVYKLDVRFDPAGPGPAWFIPGPMPTDRQTDDRPLCIASLSDQEKSALAALQAELPLVSRPFDQMLNSASGHNPVSMLTTLAGKGVLGKIAAVVDYKRLGYVANAMVCLAAHAGRVDALGRELARIPAVSHCYRRRTYPDWPYALYAMFHADALDRIDAFVRRFCHTHTVSDYMILPTVREFKKSPVRIAF